MAKSSRSRKNPEVPAAPLDLTQQIAERIDIVGRPSLLAPLNGDKMFRRTYVVGSMERSGRLRERVLSKCCWSDLRSATDAELPPMEGAGASLWVIEPATDDPLSPGENAFMGMLYRTSESQLVLARPRTQEDAWLDGLMTDAGCECSDENCCGGKSDGLSNAILEDDDVVLISTTNCERSRPVNLSAYVNSGFSTTRAAAIKVAKGLAQKYGDDVARARGHGESCGAGCKSCSSGSANVTITDTDSSLSLIASAAYGEWRYSGYAEFNYSFRVGCCRVGPA